MLWGTSYYPETTPEDQWRADLEAMRGAGLTVLRILDIVWSSIEPREGEYRFDWLDRFLGLAQELGMSVILCTPTAAPPPWLTAQYPQVMIRRRDGSVHHPGGRRDVDVDSEIFRHFAVELATVMGRRFGRHPAVIGWQIDNELIGPEGEPPESHTEATTFRFRQYLKRVHGDIATLNARWGLRFWSEEFSDWGEVNTPLNSRAALGHVLDYSRYFSDSQKEFLRLQYAALRGVIEPRQWVSHNSTAVFDRGLDHADWARSLDVAGWDAYFGAAGRPYPEAFAALAHDLFRSARHEPFWVFETNPMDARATPAFLAEMRARGARGVILWHWRCHRANAENQTNTLCDYAGRPDPQRLAALRAITSHPDLAGESPSPTPRAAAALLFCPDCVRPHLSPDPYFRRGLDARVSYLRVLIETYRALWRHGVAVDVVRPGDPLEDYRLLVAPSPKLLGGDACAAIVGFVERGGVLLNIAKAALQDPWGVYHETPGEPLEPALGYVVPRDFCVPAEPHLHGSARLDGDPTDHPCLNHLEAAELTTGQAIGHFTAGPLRGQPAAARHAHGRGVAYSALTCAPTLLAALLRRAARDAAVTVHEPLGDDTALCPDPNAGANAPALWVLHHGTQPLHLPTATLDPGGFLRLPPPPAPR